MLVIGATVHEVEAAVGAVVHDANAYRFWP